MPNDGHDRLIPIDEVSNLIGLKRGAIYNRVREDAFPKPIRLSQRCSRWRMSAVRAWIDARANEVPA